MNSLMNNFMLGMLIILSILVIYVIYKMHYLSRQVYKLSRGHKTYSSNDPNQIKYIKEVLSLIDMEIQNEVIYKLKDVIYLNKFYDPLSFDDDINEISNNVFNRFSNEIFSSSTKSVVKSEFWMYYIIEKTTDTILIVYNESQKNNMTE